MESSSDDESSGKEGSRESPKSDLVKGDDDNEDDDDDSDEDTSEDSDDDDEMDADLNPFGSDGEAGGYSPLSPPPTHAQLVN